MTDGGGLGSDAYRPGRQALIEEFTAAENAALPLEAAGLSVAEARGPALDQLSRVGLAGLENRFPRQMFGGQRQRVGVARALTGSGRSYWRTNRPAHWTRRPPRSCSAVPELREDGDLAVICSHDPCCRDVADTVYEVVDGRLEFRS